jgi:hypothetical protein
MSGPLVQVLPFCGGLAYVLGRWKKKVAELSINNRFMEELRKASRKLPSPAAATASQSVWLDRCRSVPPHDSIITLLRPQVQAP